MQINEELKLVERAKTGDKEALGELWDAITPKLYGYLVNILKNKTVADDLLQETWLSAIKGLNKFRPRGIRFSAWVFAIARNECKQYLRSAGKQSAESSLNDFEDKIPTTTYQKSGDQIYLESILKKLSAEDQEILRLKYIADLSFLEIAKILAISIVAARVRVHRAIARCRESVNS